MSAPKILICTSICIAALTIAYYFLFYLSHHRLEELAKDREDLKLAELSRQCMEDGNKMFAQFKAEHQDKDLIWDPAEFHLSKELHTCLAHTRFIKGIDQNISLQYNEMFDVYGHMPLFYGWVKRDTSSSPWKEELIDTLDDKPNYISGKYFDEKAKAFGR